MIELKKEFRKKGTKFRQLFKDDDLVIYELSRNGEDGNGYHWYEVFRRYVKAADIYHADQFEKYPYDECFGVWAWSCSNEKTVNKVLKEHFPNHPMTKTGFKC